MVKGAYQETFRLVLKVVDAHVDLTVQSISAGQTAAWSSKEGPERHDYFVRGSFSNWQLLPMTPEAHEDRMVYRLQGQTGTNSKEFFNIVVDEDEKLVIYPELGATAAGKSVVKGPDADGSEDFWEMNCWQPDVRFSITFDPQAYDKRNKVRVTWLGPRMDLDTMKAVVEQAFLEE